MNMETTQVAVQIDALGEDTQDLLRKLIKNGVIELKPKMEKNGIRYPQAEEAWKMDLNETKSTLRKMEKEGILKADFAERILTCQDCGSPDLHSKYTCPRCKSYNVEFTELLEHIKCGNIGPKESFTKGSSLICSRCQGTLVKQVTDYRVIGNYYQCEKCGYRFDKPEVIHACQNCGATSTYQEAKYIKTFVYKMTEEAIRDLQKELPVLKGTKKTLTDKGYKLQVNTKITGSSGAQSSFDIFAVKNETRLAIDVSITGTKNDIVALLAKKVDVNPTKTIIIDLSPSDELTNLGKIYGIEVFKAAGNQDSLPGFDGFLTSLDSKTNSKKPARTGGE